VRLPGIDGVTVLRRALALKPNLVVVMMSAHSTIDVAVEAMKYGAIDFLVKPFPLAQMDAAVERAVATAATRNRVAGLAEVTPNGSAPPFLGSSPACERVRELLARLASSNATTVLVEGESGAGKEVVARNIHAHSARAARPFLQLNCAAMPEQLLESELFGHERGAFTDAKTQKQGLFEAADGGTVLLDEIGDLPAGGQAKLLRLLEEKTFRRVGGVAELRSDVRVIAATNVDLEKRVREGHFRADLYFRLNVVRITVPPLRERTEDIPTLSALFIARFNKELGRNVYGVSPLALDRLKEWHWPGNVRELRNVIERALILHPESDEVRPEHLPAELAGAAGKVFPSEEPTSLFAAEQRLIEEAMEKAHGNQSKAARSLGVSRDTLRYRLKKFGMLS